MAPVSRACHTVPKRLFHVSARRNGPNPLFHLQGLSTSRETQWFSKASGLPRVEHSPGLQLLRSEAELQRSAKGTSRASPSETSSTSATQAPRASSLAKSDVAATARPWIRRLRKELDEFDRALANHRILSARHGTARANDDLNDTSDIEQTYEARLQQQDAEIAMLRSQLLEEQARYQSDHKSWAAVKMTMNSHKERAEAAGALSIVIATVLAAVLYYEQYHKPRHASASAEASDVAPSGTPAATPGAAEVERLPFLPAIAGTASRDLPAAPQPAALPPTPQSRPQQQRMRRGLFWDN